MLPGTHVAHVLPIIGGTDHVLPDKGDNSGVGDLLVENTVTILVVYNEYLSLPKLWSQLQLGCREHKG